jgi:hypothetical protein
MVETWGQKWRAKRKFEDELLTIYSIIDTGEVFFHLVNFEKFETKLTKTVSCIYFIFEADAQHSVPERKGKHHVSACQQFESLSSANHHYLHGKRS